MPDEVRYQRCETCQWWQPFKKQDGDRGICHRYPPTAQFPTDTDPAYFILAHTWRIYFCGEWTERPVEKIDLRPTFIGRGKDKAEWGK